MIENNDIGVGVTDSVSTDAPLESAQIPEASEEQTVTVADDSNVAEVESHVEIDVEAEAEVDKVIAEAEAEAAKDNSSLAKHLRKVIASKEAEIKRLSANAPTDTDQEAAELYKGLTSFDNENNRPSAKPFAEKLVAKDAKLAYQTVIDLASQPVPGDENGWSIGHHYLQANGIDPSRLDEVRQFLQNGEKISFTEVPAFVPAEYADAYKSLSEKTRDYLDYQLDSDDADEQKAAHEVLQDKQYRIDQRKTQEQQKVESQTKMMQEVTTEVETSTFNTFNEFVDKFYETPTYTAATISGNPAVDTAIKKSVNQMVLNLGDINSVSGKQALNYFKELGVSIDTAKIQETLDIVYGSIETGVKAGKVGAAPAKAQADTAKLAAMQRLSAIRNSIFANTVKVLAQGQQAAQQPLQSNAMPSFGNSSQIAQGESKQSTSEMIREMVERAKSS